MPRYRLKDSGGVEAQQWGPGVEIDGVTEKGTDIHYSDRGDLYYVTRGDDQPSCWMSVEAVEGEVPEDKRKEGGLFSPCYAQFRLNDGRVYYRSVLSFTTWKVQSQNGKVEPLSEETDLFKDYASLMDWPKQRKAVAILKTPRGNAGVYPGDWVITRPDGTKSVITDKDFQAQYRLD